MKNEEASVYRNKTFDPSYNAVFLDYLTKTLYRNDQQPLDPQLNVCDEYVMSSFVVAYMRRNHFLITEVDQEIEALQSNGMLGLWVKKYTSQQSAKFKSKAYPSSLKMNDLRGAFDILLPSLLICFLCFSAEVLIFWIKAKCRATVQK